MSITAIHLRSTPLLMVTGAEVSMVERLKFLSSAAGWSSEIRSIAQEKATEEILLSLRRNDPHVKHSGDTITASVMGVATTSHILGKAQPQQISTTFDAILANHRPASTVLFVNARDSVTVSYTQQKSYPTIYFLSEDFFARPEHLPSDATSARILYSGGSNLVVPSHFLAERVQQAWGFRPKVFLDVTSPKAAPAGILNPKKHVSIMHPYEHKGIDVFIDLAQSLPQLPFLCVAGFGDSFRSRLPRLQSLPNVTLRPFTGDISTILAESLVVVVPSLCRDVYPRVILESLSAGVPVVASDIGGCREAGGDAVRYVPVDITDDQVLGTTSTLSWMRAMRELLTAPNYKELQDNAKARYASYQKELNENMRAFMEWCEASVQASNAND